MENFYSSLLSVAAWLAGETGKVMIAGAFGGLFRWLGQKRRFLTDGVISVVSGAIAALYLPPLLVSFLELWGLNFSLEGQGAQSMGFFAGIVGMSFAKWATAFVEYRMSNELKNLEDPSDEQ